MLKQSNFLKIFAFSCFNLFIVVALMTATSSTPCAQANAGCAPDTWIAMANQAAIQTRREDVMNKRYIVKADSVLQYSCFHKELENTVNNTGPIFSTGDHWVNKSVGLIRGGNAGIAIYNAGGPELSPAALAEGMGLTVGNKAGGPLFDYILGNFDHMVLSGTTGLTDIGLCYNMANVWRAAKCKNFDGTAVFYSLEDLTGVPNFVNSPDPREFPPNMACIL